MTIAERNNKLKHFITCLKCEVSGKCCDDNCSTQYDAGNMGEIIENLEAISKALEQETVSKEVYDHEYFLRKEFEIKIGKLEHQLKALKQESKTGHWIVIDDCELFMAKCSECGEVVDSRMISKYPYCHCGARMIEPQESEDKE